MTAVSTKASSRIAVCAALALLPLACLAQARPILDKLRSGAPLVIAHREASIPFSYVSKTTHQPEGYAIDICLKMAEALRRKAGVKTSRIEYVQVVSGNRIDFIEQGKADLECGSTSNTQDRRERVAFAIPHFITGARLLVKADSPIERLEDLQGKHLVSTTGTTPLKAALQANRERLLRINITEVPDHLKGVEMVEKGQADAFVMDDVLLFGLAASRPDPKALKVVGKFLTAEAIAVMLPKGDVEAKKVIDEEMRRLIFSHEIFALYDKWFMTPIPATGTALTMPVSYLLRDFWKFPTDFVPM